MEWININTKPEDDQIVFVINSKVDMLPIKAYYHSVWDEFISIENPSGNVPLSVTHWMPLCGPPKE
jgi:hypothetical protein